MVTAKNLQLLDDLGNNISPAVNIETLYYELLGANGIIYRNHVFKHFPVYVKYNGKPDVSTYHTSFISGEATTGIAVPFHELITQEALSQEYKTVNKKDYYIPQKDDVIKIIWISLLQRFYLKILNTTGITIYENWYGDSSYTTKLYIGNIYAIYNNKIPTYYKLINKKDNTTGKTKLTLERFVFENVTKFDKYYAEIIAPYNNKIPTKWWPVAAKPKVVEVGEYTSSPYASTDINLYELTNQLNPAPIMVSGVRQTKLSDGNDFMRLDISTYNLSEIIAPYATKDWVDVRYRFLETYTYNLGIYVSPLLLLDPKTYRTIIKTNKNIGNLKTCTPIKSDTGIDNINGLRYEEILDKILIGPEQPKITPLKYTVTTKDKIYINNKILVEIDKALPLDDNGRGVYTYTNIINANPIYIRNVEDTIITHIKKPEYSPFKMDNESIKLPKIVKRMGLTYINKNGEKKEGTYISGDNIDSDSILKTNNEIKFPLSIYKVLLEVHRNNMQFNVEFNTSYNIPLRDSLGQIIATTSTNPIIDDIRNNQPVVVEYEGNEIHLGTMYITGNDNMGYKCISYINGDYKVRYPIYFGHLTNLANMQHDHVEPGKFNQITYVWDTTRVFYIAVPKILVAQMLNPFPFLNKIKHQNRWVNTTNFNITNVYTNMCSYNRYNQYDTYNLYTVFQISPYELGEHKHIKFVIDLRRTNMIEVILEAKNKIK